MHVVLRIDKEYLCMRSQTFYDCVVNSTDMLSILNICIGYDKETLICELSGDNIKEI